MTHTSPLNRKFPGISCRVRAVWQDGKPRELADFRGKVVAVYFGYTHCPDVCRRSMGVSYNIAT